MPTSIRVVNGPVPETPSFKSPVEAGFVSYAGIPMAPGRHDAPLVLQDVSPISKIIVRAGPDTSPGRRLATPFGASRIEGDVLIAGMRPDEWTLLGPGPASRALTEVLDRSGHVSVIDVTHSRAMFPLTGAEAVSVLEKLCNLDWCDPMTPDGAAVSRSVARVTCDIVRNDRDGVPSYLISCDRSYDRYLFSVILDAGQEFGLCPLGDA